MHTPGHHPQDEPQATTEVNELIAALVAEIEWLRKELEYWQLLGELPAAVETGSMPRVVDALKADPNLEAGDRDRLIALYRDLLRQRTRNNKKPDSGA